MIRFENPDQVTNFLATDLKNYIYKYKDSSENLDDEWKYILLLLRMIQLQECKDEELWRDFRQEILHNNRFFPQSIFLDKIKSLSAHVVVELKKGTELYRCREYSSDELFSNDFILRCMEFIKNELPELDIKDSDFRNYSMLTTIISGLAMKPGIEQRLKEEYRKEVKSHDDFWGYDEEKSDAPPEDYTKSMRANPEGIRYLYAAEELETALSEMRPQFGQTFSVATIEVLSSIKLFDFTNEDVIITEAERGIFSRNVLDKVFSEANYGNSIEYVPTQFLCEFIKLQGFDGIRFHSALSQGGKNIVLFDVNSDSKKYRITGSAIYSVNNIKLDYSKVLPVPEEDLGKVFETGEKDR